MSKRYRFWTSHPLGISNEGKAWHFRVTLGRIEVGAHLYHHTYPSTSDRWVLQPWLRYDRKSQTQQRKVS